jgi:insulysin
LDFIIKKLFEYIELLKEKKVDKETFQEVIDLANLKFKFKEKSEPENCALSISINMSLFKKEHAISGSNLIYETDYEKIENLLKYFNPDNFL